MTQQLKTFLIQNIPADISHFELYSGVDPNNLSLTETNIIPDKFGFAKINFQEYKRAAAIYYKWKAVDVFNNKSDFSDANILTLDNSQIFDKFIIQQINSDMEISVTESVDPIVNLGVTPKEGFYRYRTALKKADTKFTNFSQEQILYSNQENGAISHSLFMEIQPAKVYPGEKIRIYWRVEAGINASITNPSSQVTQLFNSISPVSLNGVIEDISPLGAGAYTFTLNSDGQADSLMKTASYEVISGSPSITFNSSSTDIFEGDSITLDWNCSGADNIYIDNGIGLVSNPSGNIIVYPTETTIYTLICHDTSGAISERAIKVSVKRKPLINSFKSGDITIIKGDQSHLGWSVSYANLISISGIGDVFNSDKDVFNIINSLDVSPLSTTTYTLTASDKNGQTVTSDYTITVIEPPEILSYTITPNSSLINAGDSVTFDYSVQNADSFSIDGPDSISYSTSSNFTGSFLAQLLAANPPVFERKVSFKATATKNTLTDLKTITISIQTPTPILYTGTYENPDTTLTDIITDYNNINAIELTFNTIWGDSVSAEYTTTDPFDPISPFISNPILTFNRDGSVYNHVTTIDFSNSIDQTAYDAGSSISFILAISGPAGILQKNIIFTKTGITSIT